MSVLDLRAFVSRSRALVDSAPPTTGRETRAWLVDPFLETLGWDVHADSCVTDVSVDGTHLEYVCAVESVPALLVAVEPFEESLDKSRAVGLLETMAWTGIDRAIYTNGRDYLLLAGTTDAERLACRLSSLPDHESAIAHYSRETVGRRLERHSRAFVARQLAIERDALVDAIVSELTNATEQGAAYRSEFESATDRFLDRLVASFADDDRDQPAGELEADTGSDVSIEFSEVTRSADEDGRSSHEDRQSVDQRSESTNGEYIARNESDDSAATEDGGPPESARADSSAAPENPTDNESDGSAGAEAEPDVTDGDVDRSSDRTPDRREDSGDGEYVVRFFSDRGSIGAIGHSRADQALVQAAEYLFERGLSGVTVPWSPDGADDARAVLNDSPTHADGSPMGAPQQLSNGLYLETAGETAEQADRVESLVARAGLRAMLTGDWESGSE